MHDELKKYFSSLSQTMLSLFMSISGGVSWEELVFPLQATSEAMGFSDVPFQNVG